MPPPPVFQRSPRLKPTLPHHEIEIPAPSPDPESSAGYAPLLTTLLPLILTIVVMVALGLFTDMGSRMLVFSVPLILVSGVASVVLHFEQKRRMKRKKKERIEQYRYLLSQKRHELLKLQREQQGLRWHNDPDPDHCLTERVQRGDRNLWARSPEEKDFLDLRIGLGTQPSTVLVKPPQSIGHADPDPLVLDAQALAKQFDEVPDVPITFSLPQAGIVGLAAEQRSDAINAVRALLIQLATHHAPTEVKLIVLYPADEELQWSWLRWLPHVWSDGRKRRYLANQRESAHELLYEIDDFLDQRQNQLKATEAQRSTDFPFYLVFVLADATLIENEPLIQRLQQEGPQLGAYSVFLGARVRDLPRSCRTAIKISGGTSQVIINQPHTESHEFIPDMASRQIGEQFARSIAPIRLQQAAAKDIPDSITLLDLLHAQNVAELEVARRWQASHGTRRSLAASIGLRAGAEPLVLDLHERKHGPNGLVAGMVGAGKSELLQTLVASLAIHYHPYKIAFALVDYKGGGMADPFLALPHTLGVITNLQKGNLATRALTSFRVEMKRRQYLFREAGVNHIDDYQRLYYSGKVAEPMPHLVIIVDEFAEMKTEQPDTAGEFVKIARLGRALGLCLILAMQKPAGIVDGQIEGNTRFRLCLRVASTEDSQAMLKRTEAAFLAGLGRAYLQVGANEYFELFQVAYSGAPYDPGGLWRQDPHTITQIDLDGKSRVLYPVVRKSPESEVRQLAAVVEHIISVAHQEPGFRKMPDLWLPPLPEQVVLPTIRSNEGWNETTWQAGDEWLVPVIGLTDDPTNKLQEPLRLNLAGDGHVVVYGAPGSGKTTLLQTLITSLALSYSPQDVHLYVIDFGGRLLKMFETLPHVGAVIVADEVERLERLFAFLLKEIDARRELFAQAGVNKLVEYRKATGEALPAIVVILDNYANFHSTYQDDDTKEASILQLARDGASLGVHLVLTTNELTSIRFKITSNINMAIALQMVERSDYTAIVGRTDGLIPEPVPGRGLIRANPPLEFQTALPAHGESDAERTLALRVIMKQMAATWQGVPAPPVEVMPSIVAFSDILSPRQHWADANGDGVLRLSVPLGLQALNLKPLMVDLVSGPNFLIAGPSQSGKTTLLQTWLLALAECYSPDRLKIFILDSLRAGLASLAKIPHIQAYSCQQEQADQTLSEIRGLVQQRRRVIDEIRRQGSDISDVHLALGEYPTIVLALDDAFDPYDDGSSDSGKSDLASIIAQGRGLKFHTLLAGPLDALESKSWSEPIKSLKASQTGFMLGSSTDTVFALRLPHSEREKLLPCGEGFWVQKGQVRRVRVATAQVGTPQLDERILRLAARASWVDASGKAGSEIVIESSTVG